MSSKWDSYHLNLHYRDNNFNQGGGGFRWFPRSLTHFGFDVTPPNRDPVGVKRIRNINVDMYLAENTSENIFVAAYLVKVPKDVNLNRIFSDLYLDNDTPQDTLEYWYIRQGWMNVKSEVPNNFLIAHTVFAGRMYADKVVNLKFNKTLNLQSGEKLLLFFTNIKMLGTITVYTGTYSFTGSFWIPDITADFFCEVAY